MYEGFVAISAGESFAMAMDVKGRLYCWGEVGSPFYVECWSWD